MASVRQFDEEDVLDRIVEAFWRRGFHATSVDDLAGATGVEPGSLAAAFGDRDRMFLQAFERYALRVEEYILEPLGRSDLWAGLEEMARRRAETLADPATPPGCLIASSIAEVGGRDDAIAQAVRKRHADTETVLHERLVRAQAIDEIAAGRDVRALARHIAATLRAASLIHGLTGDVQAATDITAVAIGAVG